MPIRYYSDYSFGNPPLFESNDAQSCCSAGSFWGDLAVIILWIPKLECVAANLCGLKLMANTFVNVFFPQKKHLESELQITWCKNMCTQHLVWLNQVGFLPLLPSQSCVDWKICVWWNSPLQASCSTGSCTGFDHGNPVGDSYERLQCRKVVGHEGMNERAWMRKSARSELSTQLQFWLWYSLGLRPQSAPPPSCHPPWSSESLGGPPPLKITSVFMKQTWSDVLTHRCPMGLAGLKLVCLEFFIGIFKWNDKVCFFYFFPFLLRQL